MSFIKKTIFGTFRDPWCHIVTLCVMRGYSTSNIVCHEKFLTNLAPLCPEKPPAWRPTQLYSSSPPLLWTLLHPAFCSGQGSQHSWSPCSPRQPFWWSCWAEESQLANITSSNRSRDTSSRKTGTWGLQIIEWLYSPSLEEEHKSLPLSLEITHLGSCLCLK